MIINVREIVTWYDQDGNIVEADTNESALDSNDDFDMHELEQLLMFTDPTDSNPVENWHTASYTETDNSGYRDCIEKGYTREKSIFALDKESADAIAQIHAKL